MVEDGDSANTKRGCQQHAKRRRRRRRREEWTARIRNISPGLDKTAVGIASS
jgi:hypothetical protein